MFRPTQPAVGRFSLVLGWLLVALVLTLAVLAASPDLHERLHAGDPAHAHPGAPDVDEGCVIQLFAHGLTTPLCLLTVAPPSAFWTESPAIIRRQLNLSSPRYLRHPERGPPVIG